MVRSTDRPAMTIAVDLGRKATKQTKPKQRSQFWHLEVLITYEPRHGFSNNVVCATIKASDQPAHTRSQIRAIACCLNIL